MARRPSTPIGVVIGTIAVLLVFVVFLLVFKDLNQKLWVQGMVGLILALIIAVILFSVVQSQIHVRGAALWGGVLGISGAALFYLLLLPRIKPFIFPAHSISGYVFYKTNGPQDPLIAVQGVTAVVPATGQKSAPTDATGSFIIGNVYEDASDLLFQHAGNTYPAKTSDHKDGRYAIIPQRPTEPPQTRRPVEVKWELVKTYKCDLMAEKGYVTAAGYQLTANLPRNDVEVNRNAKKLHVKASLAKEFGDLTQPNDLEPRTSNDFDESGDVPGRVLGWEWPDINLDRPNVKIALCVNRRKVDKVAGPDNFLTLYWYGVMR